MAVHELCVSVVSHRASVVVLPSTLSNPPANTSSPASVSVRGSPPSLPISVHETPSQRHTALALAPAMPTHKPSARGSRDLADPVGAPGTGDHRAPSHRINDPVPA